MSFGGSKLTMKDGILKEVCRLQSLLIQFIHPKVRKDFINGLLGIEGSEAILSDLDLIRIIVIPPWHGGPALNMQLHLDTTATHLDNLLNHSSDIFDLQSPNAHSWTYKDWANFLSDVATSTYWAITDPGTICVNQLTVPMNVKSQEFCSTTKSIGDPEERGNSDQFKRDRPLTFDVCNDSPKCDNLVKSRRHAWTPNHSTQLPTYNIETISLSDSSSYRDETSSESSVESRNSKRRRRKHSQKEIVKPLAFEINGPTSLRSFFSNYERYFSSKFDGTSRDCTQELKQFLPYEMEQYYNALGGRRLKYRHMKEELAKWYKARKRGGTRFWKEQLKETEIMPGEELRLYGMRLLEKGRKAYPNSDRECMKEVTYHYLNTVPGEFANYVRQSEQMIKVVDRERKLKWADIMKLAEAEDEQREITIERRKLEISSSPRVWFSRDDNPDQSPSAVLRSKKGEHYLKERENIKLPITDFHPKRLTIWEGRIGQYWCLSMVWTEWPFGGHLLAETGGLCPLR